MRPVRAGAKNTSEKKAKNTGFFIHFGSEEETIDVKWTFIEKQVRGNGELTDSPADESWSFSLLSSFNAVPCLALMKRERVPLTSTFVYHVQHSFWTTLQLLCSQRQISATYFPAYSGKSPSESLETRTISTSTPLKAVGDDDWMQLVVLYNFAHNKALSFNATDLHQLYAFRFF